MALSPHKRLVLSGQNGRIYTIREHVACCEALKENFDDVVGIQMYGHSDVLRNLSDLDALQKPRPSPVPSVSYLERTSCVKNSCKGQSTEYSRTIPSHPSSDICVEISEGAPGSPSA
ncbi:hypothetical protein Leryth_023159 [Lithospermum erythrorhizon]|nr:hypothetical protein Leryth_023159 [Lithospermum erythrorhizon]